MTIRRVPSAVVYSLPHNTCNNSDIKAIAQNVMLLRSSSFYSSQEADGGDEDNAQLQQLVSN